MVKSKNKSANYKTVLKDANPKTMRYGNYPTSMQGAWDPASANQFNRDERTYWSDNMFALQGQRQLNPCPNGAGQFCGVNQETKTPNRLLANEGGSNLGQAVNSTFLGSQTSMSNMGFRPDYNAFLVEGAIERAAAYQLVSQEAMDGSLDGSYAFCTRTCPAGPGGERKSCGWCVQPPIAHRDPGETLFTDPQTFHKRDAHLARQKSVTRVGRG